MVEQLLTAIGLTKGATIGGFFGALVSLKFIEGLFWWQRIPTVFAGMMAAAYCTPLVMEMFTISVKTEAAIAFLIGVFGMSLMGAVVKALPELSTAAINYVKERWLK